MSKTYNIFKLKLLYTASTRLWEIIKIFSDCVQPQNICYQYQSHHENCRKHHFSNFHDFKTRISNKVPMCSARKNSGCSLMVSCFTGLTASVVYCVTVRKLKCRKALWIAGILPVKGNVVTVAATFNLTRNASEISLFIPLVYLHKIKIFSLTYIRLYNKKHLMASNWFLFYSKLILREFPSSHSFRKLRLL